MSDTQQPTSEQQLAKALYELSNSLALNADPSVSEWAQTVSNWADQVAAIAIGQRTAQYVQLRDDLRKQVDELNGKLAALQTTAQVIDMLNKMASGVDQFLGIIQNIQV